MADRYFLHLLINFSFCFVLCLFVCSFFQYIIAPVKTGYGFEQPPGPTFPIEPEPDYLPSVRLFINPVPSPDSKIQRMMR